MKLIFLIIKKEISRFLKIQNESKQADLNNTNASIGLLHEKSPGEREIEIEKQILEKIDRGEINNAIDAISIAVLEFCGSNEFLGKKIYLPLIDKLVENISKKILKSIDCEYMDYSHQANYTAELRPIIIATELYFEGGHTRIVEELINLYPNIIIIMTNFFPVSSRSAEVAAKAVKKLPMLVLPTDTAENNIIRLNNLCNTLASKIYHLGHHHDVVLNAAICSKINVPVYFIHHSDHKPSLGNTIKSFIHIDIVKHMHALCSSNLNTIPLYWPQGVYDSGVKKFTYPIKEIFTASSGSHTKFSWSGDESYPNIIVNLLLNGVTAHYHIGSLEMYQHEHIVSSLYKNGIDVDRLKFIGPVESLWKTLLDSPINCYVGSNLIHGLRTAIEVQGAGIPILPFLQSRDLPFMIEKEHYNPEAVYWRSVDELCGQIKKIKLIHHSASESARNFYLNNFTVESMKNAIQATSETYR